MCFVTTNINKKVAEENIVCYKVVKLSFWQDIKKLLGKKPKTVKSYYENYKYKTNKLNIHIKIIPIDYGSRYCIYEGYHFYPYKTRPLYVPTDNYDVIKCIIPKGTIYYESDCEPAGVAENIIVTNIIIN